MSSVVKRETAKKRIKMKSNIEKTDTELQQDVLEELRYEPSVKVTDIGVLVKNGAVTLNGYATSYGEKWDAVRAAKRVAGVNALADDIEVKLPDSLRRTDGEIAAAAAEQIKWSTTIPAGAAQVTVSNGWVTIEGQVEWWFQRNAAENVVQSLAGVKGVTNLITIEPKLAVAPVENAIRSAFKRSALLDAKNIQVQTSGNKVVLRGKVRNHAEREEAERAAWAASGVFSVDNQLKVEWSLDYTT
jgi:osmotically-inducible protein OsmY